MATHPSVGRVSSVWSQMRRRGGSWHHAISDLVWIEGRPHAVIEWRLSPGGDLPALTLPLDPAQLKLLGPGDAEFLYHAGLEDPRPLT